MNVIYTMYIRYTIDQFSSFRGSPYIKFILFVKKETLDEVHLNKLFITHLQELRI